jgi:hypothetical protein
VVDLSDLETVTPAAAVELADLEHPQISLSVRHSLSQSEQAEPQTLAAWIQYFPQLHPMAVDLVLVDPLRL